LNLEAERMKELQHTQSDTYELLSTKLALPRQRPSLVPREPLLTRLDEGLEHKLVLLSAPAGFGKTTLVSEWIATRSERQDSPPVAWVSLDAGDNDPVRFWRYLITACQAFDAALGGTALALLRTSGRLSWESVLTTFINELAQLESRGVLVLEDYHVITSLQIHEAVTYLFDHLPASLRLVILTRSDPPLPLARLRAHDDLYELHAADLRFSLEETQTFLRQALPFPLDASAIARLEARTEGWVAGLRLLALALQERKDPQDLEYVLMTFTGGHRHILEYLVADVLSSQPELLQEFLLQTAFLNRLTGSLCDAVTGRNDSELMLEQLEHANLFLIPLDDEGKWYRYHSLFAEAMQHEARRRLGEDSLRSLYDKASRWYEEHGLLAEAVEVALSARDFDRATRLIERIVGPQSITNELHTLMRWLEQLPQEVLQSHPVLSMAYAIALLFTLDRSNPATRAYVLAPLEVAERYWQAEGNRPKLGEVLAFRSLDALWQGDLPQALAAARQTLELLPEQEMFWRGTSILTAAMGDALAGKPEAARQATLEARTLFEDVGNPYGARAATYILGEVNSLQGELHAAARFYRQEIAGAAEDPLDMANALIGLAALSYEWNELQTAEQEVSQALDIGKRHADELGKYHAELSIKVPGSLVLARVLHARGDTVQAQRLLQELVVLTQERRWPYLHREVLAEQARLQLSGADVAAAQRWSATITQLGEDFRLLQQEREALINARLLIAQGEAEAALRLLDHWQADAHAWRRERSELEILVLMALAHFKYKHLPQARQILREALALAQAERYQRLFLDEGEKLATLLRAVLLDVREEPLITYVRSLLLAFVHSQSEQNASPPSQTSSALLIEPLSPQEQRVLRLLAAGRSNPEIAQELVVSVNTVKTQVQSIYRKLNVKSRWEARDAASHLKLL
jgi:LuxR family transcriptional regulator, maltose regulon positive regulatory protein